MSTILLTHPDCLGHDPGLHHPESARRLSSALEALDGPEFTGLLRRTAPLGEQADIVRVHPPQFLASVLDAVPSSGHAALDGDTILSAGSGRAALRAVGAATAAVDAVIGGEAVNAFCAVRPPGHHAEPERAMGFCLFNAVAIAARRAQAVHGIARVAIVDFDVHHGNGTQAAVEDDATLFYASTHQAPLYPGTGAATETGVGNVVNVPLRAGADGAVFRKAFAREILPALEAFRPGLVLVSAGFDAHRADPLAGLELEESDFAWITDRLTECASRHCDGMLVSILEGGYDLRALAGSTAAHVKALQAGRP